MTEEQQKFIDYINNKITPFVLKKSAVNKLFLLLEKYSLKLLYECAEISFAKYLEYDKNDVPTQESASLAIDKIGGIAYNRSLSPIDQEIIYLCNKGKNRYSYWNDDTAKCLLNNYVEQLLYHLTEEQVLDDLKIEVSGLFTKKKNWSEWRSQIEWWTEDIINWKDKNEAIITQESILPNIIFKDAPHNIILLKNQINSSYENKLYDCTAITMCRLVEILLIYAYSKNGQENRIKKNNHFFSLSEIVYDLKENNFLSLSPNLAEDLLLIENLKELSTKRIFLNFTKTDIDTIKTNFRVLVEELLYKAKMR